MVPMDMGGRRVGDGEKREKGGQSGEDIGKKFSGR
jgi:hypothetical protein